MHGVKRAKCQRVWWSAQQEQDALCYPERRASMDVLESLLRLDGVAARAALEAIAMDPHRGWLDTLLDAHGHHVRWGLDDLWRQTSRACMGTGSIDADFVELLSSNQPCEAKMPVTILRADGSTRCDPLVRRTRPLYSMPLRRGRRCPNSLLLTQKNLTGL